MANCGQTVHIHHKGKAPEEHGHGNGGWIDTSNAKVNCGPYASCGKTVHIHHGSNGNVVQTGNAHFHDAVKDILKPDNKFKALADEHEEKSKW